MGKETNGAAHVAEVGIPAQRHNRYFAKGAAINAHDGADTYATVTWTQAENVRRYRVLVTGGSAGDYVKIVEDAPSGAAAALWLDDATSSTSPLTTDAEHWIHHTSDPISATAQGYGWSEWREMSKDGGDLSLGRLDFEASAADTDFVIWVEAE